MIKLKELEGISIEELEQKAKKELEYIKQQLIETLDHSEEDLSNKILLLIEEIAENIWNWSNLHLSGSFLLRYKELKNLLISKRNNEIFDNILEELDMIERWKLKQLVERFLLNLLLQYKTLVDHSCLEGAIQKAEEAGVEVFDIRNIWLTLEQMWLEETKKDNWFEKYDIRNYMDQLFMICLANDLWEAINNRKKLWPYTYENFLFHIKRAKEAWFDTSYLEKNLKKLESKN